MKLIFPCVIYACVVLAALGCGVKTTSARVEAGVADLSEVSFSDGRIFELNGIWEYYPNRIIAPQEIGKNLAAMKLARLPKSFNRYDEPDLKLPAEASATYRVNILLPPKPQRYTFRIPPPATASKIYVNGNLEIENGTVSENLTLVRPRTKLHYLELTLAGRTELLVQVSNADFRKGGIWQPISIGERTDMDRARLGAVALDVLVAVSLITFALYHIFLFFLRHPETSSVYYGLFCLMVGVSRLFSGEQLASGLYPAMTWGTHLRIEYFCNFLDAAFFALYARSFFPELRSNLLLKTLGITAGLFALVAVITPLHISRYLREPFQIFIGIVIPVGIFQLARLSLRNAYGARVFLTGIFIIALGFGNDALKNAEFISTPYLFSYAILIFTFLQAILISGKSVVIFRDNTELSQKLLRSDKLRDEFLTHTSHELRTPVQAMVQTIENLRRGTSGAVSAQIQRTLSVVEENGRHLIYLIDDLTDFLRLKHNDIRLDLQTVPLKKIIDPVLKLCIGMSENKQLAFIDEIPDALEDVQVDPARIQQMLMNLLNTAMRYSHSPAITIRLGVINHQLAISVFYNGNDPDPRYTEITALENEEVGPLVTQRLAELMGGNYYYRKYAESQHSLSITIPYEHIDALEALLAKSKHRTEYRKEAERNTTDFPARIGESALGGGSQVLLIGDNVSQNRLLQEQLISLGKHTLIAKNGAEAMLLLQSHGEIALVICDVLLADVSGIELAMNIRVHFDIGLLPIIMIIDNNQAGVAASAFSAGVNDLVRRPFEKAEVLARVKNVLLQREASLARENYRALGRELEIARSIQESILPISQPKSNLYKIEAVCMPARSIGGDFYDFIEDETSVAVLIADVAGHGIPAALYASMLKIAFHNLREQARFPEKLLKELNDIMIDRGERTFISCAYTLIDFKNKRLLHANAGHLPLLLQEPNRKKVKKIQPPGGVLGVRKAAAITVEMLHLQPKTRLTLFTDGVIELGNRKGEFFEEERLVSILEEMREAPLSDVKDRLLAEMRAFAEGEPFMDDVTFVILDV